MVFVPICPPHRTDDENKYSLILLKRRGKKMGVYAEEFKIKTQRVTMKDIGYGYDLDKMVKGLAAGRKIMNFELLPVGVDKYGDVSEFLLMVTCEE